MSVGKDEAVINSVYIARTPGGEAESQVLSSGSQFYVVVVAEIGTNVFNGAPKLKLYAAFQTIPSTPAVTAITVTNFTPNNNPNFPVPNFDTKFTFGPVIAGPADTLYKPLAALVIGAKEQDISVLEGNLAVVTE